MKTYEKPVVLVNEELAEGVYAASGATDCWEVNAASVQDWNGSEHIFEVAMRHKEIQHISLDCTIQISFTQTVSGVRSEGEHITCSASGNIVEVKRTNHANAYGSGDKATFKIFVNCGEEALTKSVAVGSITVVACNNQPNVQGGSD